MKIAVTDANIFIDLIKLQMLHLLFCIDMDIYTSKEIVDQLNDGQAAELATFISKGLLTVYLFSVDELQEIIFFESPRALEIADKSVAWLAIKLSATVLSGDAPLRRFCENKKLEVKGIIWLFDEFLRKKIIAHVDAVTKLEHLVSFNSRLPKQECSQRLLSWKIRSH